MENIDLQKKYDTLLEYTKELKECYKELKECYNTLLEVSEKSIGLGKMLCPSYNMMKGSCFDFDFRKMCEYIKKYENMIYGYIYVTTNVKTGKKYVGQSRLLDEHNLLEYKGSGIIISDELKKNPEDFEKKIVKIIGKPSDADEDDLKICQRTLNKWEIIFIDILCTRNPKCGYNISVGGNYCYTSYTFADEIGIRMLPYESSDSIEEYRRKQSIMEKDERDNGLFLPLMSQIISPMWEKYDEHILQQEKQRQEELEDSQLECELSKEDCELLMFLNNVYEENKINISPQQKKEWKKYRMDYMTSKNSVPNKPEGYNEFEYNNNGYARLYPNGIDDVRVAQITPEQFIKLDGIYEPLMDGYSPKSIIDYAIAHKLISVKGKGADKVWRPNTIKLKTAQLSINNHIGSCRKRTLSNCEREVLNLIHKCFDKIKYSYNDDDIVKSIHSEFIQNKHYDDEVLRGYDCDNRIAPIDEDYVIVFGGDDKRDELNRIIRKRNNAHMWKDGLCFGISYEDFNTLPDDVQDEVGGFFGSCSFDKVGRGGLRDYIKSHNLVYITKDNQLFRPIEL